MSKKPITLVLLLLSLLLSACGRSATPPPSETPAPVRITPTPAVTATFAPAPSESPTATTTLTPAPTITGTATATPVPSPTPVPTYIKLRGEVIVDQAVCHYGPGAPYLYKYGVYKGSNLEILARDEIGVYVEVQAIGGNNPCWVKGEYLKIKGNLMDLQPIRTVDVRLPISPYYKPPTVVSATRDGPVVTVFWQKFILRPGDDSEQVPYLIEAWVCKAGQLVFTPLGAYQTALKIQDEPGCASPSHARFYAVEKHGYAGPLEVPWPHAAEPTLTPTP